MQMSASWNTQHVYLGFGAWTAFTYLGLALDLGIGQRLARNTEHAGWLSLAAVLGSLQFFVVSNFGVWATGSEYVSVHFFRPPHSHLHYIFFFLIYSTSSDSSLKLFLVFFRVHSLPLGAHSEASTRTTWPA